MTNVLDKITNGVERFVEPFAKWMMKQDFIMSIGEAMQLLLPVTMFGSFATLFAFLNFGPLEALYTAAPWLRTMFMTGQALTLSIISLYVVIALPYIYAKRINLKEPLAAIAINVAAFLLVTPTSIYVNIPCEWLGHKGLFVTFFVSFFTVRTLKFCQDKNIGIKMPAGVPHFVEVAFSAMVPGIIVDGIALIVGTAMAQTAAGSIHQLIYELIQAPFVNVGGGFTGNLITMMLSTLCMFCGIHGTSVTPWGSIIYEANSLENLELISQGLRPTNIYAANFSGATNSGGIGATMGLAILLLIMTKSKRYKSLGKSTIIPSIFNISEPLLFGMPIMLNPVLFIPYMLCPIVNLIITWVVIKIGMVGYFMGNQVSWVVPTVIATFITNETPIRAGLLTLFNIVVDMLIWYPFVRMLDRQELAAEKENEA